MLLDMLCTLRHQDRYLIARTGETLLMGDLESCNLSEIPWTGDGAWGFFGSLK
jgi:intraflagellar transport protein 172